MVKKPFTNITDITAGGNEQCTETIALCNAPDASIQMYSITKKQVYASTHMGHSE